MEIGVRLARQRPARAAVQDLTREVADLGALGRRPGIVRSAESGRRAKAATTVNTTRFTVTRISASSASSSTAQGGIANTPPKSSPHLGAASTPAATTQIASAISRPDRRRSRCRNWPPTTPAQSSAAPQRQAKAMLPIPRNRPATIARLPSGAETCNGATEQLVDDEHQHHERRHRNEPGREASPDHESGQTGEEEHGGRASPDTTRG